MLLVLAACSESVLHRASGTDVFTQQGNAEVDVLWVVDDSISMSEEQALLGDGFHRFVEALGGSEVEMDLHVGVVSTDMDVDNADHGRLVGSPAWLTAEEPDFDAQFRQRVAVGTAGSDMEQGLQAAWYALGGHGVSAEIAAYNEGFVRTSANLAIVFVSDENDCSHDGAFPADSDAALCYERQDSLVPVADYVRHFQGLKATEAHVNVSGILGPAISEGCETATPGVRYDSTASAFDGYVGNICEADWSDILEGVANGIVAPSTAFALTHPALAGTVEVDVDGEPIAEDPDTGWRYDDTVQTVFFDGGYVPPSGALIQITYTIAAR